MPPPNLQRVPGVRPVAATDYRLDQLVAVPNWRAVTWTGTQHVTHRIYLIALATSVATSEPGLLVGLTYTPQEAWQVVEILPGYCGLLPPDWDLVPFEAANPCGHTPASGGA